MLRSRSRILGAVMLSLLAASLAIDYSGGLALVAPEQFPAAWIPAALRHIAGPLVEGDNLMRDCVTRFGRKTPANPDLVFLALDNDSVSIDIKLDGGMLGLGHADPESRRALELMSQGWPWSREIYALALHRLINAGARVVALDLNFPTATPNDAQFRAALEAYRHSAVIGVNFSSPTARAAGVTRPSLTLPSDTIIPATSGPTDPRLGIDNFWPDTDVDDVIRSAQFRLTAGQVNGVEFDQRQYVSMAAVAATQAGAEARIPKGFDRVPFRYTGPAGTFAPHSIFEIFAPDYWQRNYQGGEFFRGKIVILGGYGNWQHDEHPTPFGTMPGPELHLQSLNALLHGEFLVEPSAWVRLLLIAAAGLLPLFIIRKMRSPWTRVGTALVVNIGWLGATVLLYNARGLIVPIVVPLGLFNANGLAALFHDALHSRRESRRIRGALERYVSRNIVREMLDKPDAMAAMFTGVLKPATILFSDIRNFSIASAQRDPHELVTQLNEYLAAMVECVFKFNGTLDKFIGDAVMAVWGNVHTGGASADACNAVRAAQAMRERLALLNARWKAQGRPQLEIGIALNQGEVVVGNIGSPHRMEYTVIGDAVNTSWRLQELTKELNEDLLLGPSVARLVGDIIPVREVSTCVIPKTHEVLSIFTVGLSGASHAVVESCDAPAKEENGCEPAIVGSLKY